MAEAVVPQELSGPVKEKLSGFDYSLCFTCGTCSSGCPITGTPGMEGWDTRRVIRMLTYGLVDEVVDSKFPWLCTGCGRCAAACPMAIDIPYIMGFMKHLRPRDEVPGILHKGVQNNLDTGNNMAIPQEDYLVNMADMGKELAEEELPGFYVPVDNQDAKVLFFPNSKEVYGDYEDQIWWWKVFYAARENWTIPSTNWEAVDWGLFTGDYEATKVFAQRKIDHMHNYNIERMIMPDCGGGSYGCRVGMKACLLDSPDNEISYVYLYEYLKELLETGRIKVDKSLHAGKVFTWHDSCKHARELQRHFGKGYFEEPRWIIQQCVDEFVDMEPNRMNGTCCGAGGGMWPMPFEKESAYHGRIKYESIKNSGANVVVVGCSNCHDQMMKRLPKFYTDYQYEVKYIWELIADALVIEPWSEEEAARAQEEAAAQWERLGVDLDNMEY